MFGWHQRFYGREFEQAPGDGGRTGKPGVLQSMGLQKVGHDLVTEQQQPFTIFIQTFAKSFV